MMKKRIIFMFPGQGVQYYHMAYPLYKQYAVFHQWMNNASKILKDILGIDLIKKIYDADKSKAESFSDIQVTQPALVIISVGIAKLFEYYGLKPNLLLGVSLGEISAMLYADVLELRKMLSTVCDHVDDFLKFCPEGFMYSLFLDDDLMLDLSQFGCEIAAQNSNDNVVISGPKSSEAMLVDYLTFNKILYEKLPVNIAFHSKHIDSVKLKFLDRINYHVYEKPRYDIYSCARNNQISHPDNQYFWDVVSQPIQLANAISELERAGDNIYIDVGPSGGCAAVSKKNYQAGSNSSSYSFLTPFSQSVDIVSFIDDIKSKEGLL